ncbi:MAG TPA: hypothetical protein VK737_08635, partial [Opitutales bacterium]|jgi:hypothetical protein|nr:hypothetical protein [Opitutales bacterium]
VLSQLARKDPTAATTALQNLPLTDDQRTQLATLVAKTPPAPQPDPQQYIDRFSNSMRMN